MLANKLKRIIELKKSETYTFDLNDFDFTGVEEVLEKRVSINPGDMYIALLQSSCYSDYSTLKKLIRQTKSFNEKQIHALFSAWAEREGLIVAGMSESSIAEGYYIYFNFK